MSAITLSTNTGFVIMKSLEGDEQRPSRSIGQRVRDLRRLARELQDEDARKERAAAKKAEAAEQKKDCEELASAEEFCRKLANGPSPRYKAVVVSEAELLKLGGQRVKVQSRIIFGAAGETRLIFKPEGGAWRVALEGMQTREEQRRELTKSRRGLWDS